MIEKRPSRLVSSIGTKFEAIVGGKRVEKRARELGDVGPPFWKSLKKLKAGCVFFYYFQFFLRGRVRSSCQRADIGLQIKFQIYATSFFYFFFENIQTVIQKCTNSYARIRSGRFVPDTCDSFPLPPFFSSVAPSPSPACVFTWLSFHNGK